MRVIVKIDTKTHSTLGSGAARYISERSRNLEHELSGTRAIFNPEDDTLKWRAADSYLSGHANKRPRHSNLHHIMLSFDDQDAKELERQDPSDKDRPYRLITRHAMTKIAERLKITDTKWIAGVHRHSDHPHIHLLLHKEVTDSETGEKKKLGRFPFSKEMLNNRDNSTGQPVPGLISLDISEAIDNLLRRERKSDFDNRPLSTDQNLSTRDNKTAQNLSTPAYAQLLSTPQPKEPDRNQGDQSNGNLTPHPTLQSSETEAPKYPQTRSHLSRLNLIESLRISSAPPATVELTVDQAQNTHSPATQTYLQPEPTFDHAQSLGTDASQGGQLLCTDDPLHGKTKLTTSTNPSKTDATPPLSLSDFDPRDEKSFDPHQPSQTDPQMNLTETDHSHQIEDSYDLGR